MSNASDFDAFYAESWRGLLLQTFAVCGDLGIARESLQHAYVDAWHHWSRAQWQGPEGYVRSGAFARAQFRTRARAFHRSQRVTREQRATLRAMQDLAPQVRKAVVLACLSELPLPVIGKAIGETEHRALSLVDVGMAGLSTALKVPEADVARRLQGLAGAARAAAQPTPQDLRQQGVRRRRVWLGGGIAAAVAATVAAGAFVHLAPVQAEKLPPALGPEVTRSLLLDSSGLQPLGKPVNWQVLTTSDNTGGSGINSFCQAARFADPHGLRAFVRTFMLSGKQQRKAVQTIELSRTERQSREAYATVLGWYSGCRRSGLQLLSTYDVSGLGDQAMILKLRTQGQALNSYAVGVVRTGHIVTWTAIETSGARNPDTADLVSQLRNALTRACTSKAAGSCTDSSPQVKENPPPPSGEQPGMLVAADLPPVPTVSQPWNGTGAAKTADNPAATSCDRTDFAASGATSTLSRTFLTPGADVPTRFGISETLAQLPSLTQSKGIIAQVTARMNSCQDRDPGAHITMTGSQPKGPKGSAFYLWRLESEVSDKSTIVFWMGIARVGTNVAQVSFVPGDGKQDIDEAAFQALVGRTRDRLFELSSSETTPSASPSPGTE